MVEGEGKVSPVQAMQAYRTNGDSSIHLTSTLDGSD